MLGLRLDSWRTAAAVFPAMFLVSPFVPATRGLAAQATNAWTSPTTYTIAYLGRDGAGGTDHYQVQIGPGTTVLGIAADTMPLLPTMQAFGLLADAYQMTFPGHVPQDIRPGQVFSFSAPAGTLVSTQWRSISNQTSLRCGRPAG